VFAKITFPAQFIGNVLNTTPGMNPALPLLDMRGVSVMRGSNTVLSDFHLRIEDGEHVAILGPNGCGKSTLIKTITRECYPLYNESASMQIFGRDKWNIFDLRYMLGIVSNDLMSLCTREVTSYELILSGFFSSIEIMPWHEVTDSMRVKTVQVLDLLEVSHLADRPLNQLSSGEARRVLIGRALVHEPRALLLDEPSNSLDVAAQHELREIMRKLARSGIGILLVTHHLADIIPEIERVILMKSGAIVADGPKRQILTAAHLKAVFDAPIQVAERDGYFFAYV
jgi:iron complex transport system ATP-binding protein